jgi:hypothetical protein
VRPARAVPNASGYPSATQDTKAAGDPFTPSQKRVLRLLAEAGTPAARRDWLRESELHISPQWVRESDLKTSRHLLESLWARGLIEGAMLTTGATKDDRFWRLKPR